MLPLFFSTFGSPACGKSYFLASMTWKLREILPRLCNVSFSDSDPISNAHLNHYEEQQFFNPEQNKLIKLAKTEEHGDLYNVVEKNGESVVYPRPFLFSLRPLAQHAHFADPKRASRVLCLYDNAGESFQPGRDSSQNQVTRHLARSQVLMFLYDPTQDPRFREACKDLTDDIQVSHANVTTRQETVLHEVASRVRKLTGLSNNERHPRPLIVVVTKLDAWCELAGLQELKDPWVKSKQGIYGFNLPYVEKISRRTRDLLWQYSPEIVSAAEDFADRTIFVPVSATGCGPEQDQETKEIGFRPKNIQPQWVETPMLYALSQCTSGVVPFLRSKNGSK